MDSKNELFELNFPITNQTKADANAKQTLLMGIQKNVNNCKNCMAW